jgi:hypothetical protein
MQPASFRSSPQVTFSISEVTTFPVFTSVINSSRKRFASVHAAASDYGVAVATADTALDYVGGGVTVTPEPGALILLGSGLLVMLALGRAHRQRAL